MCPHGFSVTTHAIQTTRRVPQWTRYTRDFCMALRNEIGGSIIRSLHIVHVDSRNLIAGQIVAGNNKGNLNLLQRLDVALQEMDARNNDTIDLFFFEQAQVLQLFVHHFIGYRQKHTIVVLANDAVNSVNEIGVKIVGDIGNHHPDDAGFLANQAPGNRIRLKARLLHDFQDSFPQLWSDWLGIVQHARNSRDGNVGELSDIFNGYSNGSSLTFYVAGKRFPNVKITPNFRFVNIQLIINCVDIARNLLNNSLYNLFTKLIMYEGGFVMNVFLTGITGYVGSVVAEHFQSLGYQVAGLVRSEEKAELLLSQGFTPIAGDLADTTLLTEIVKKFDGVIHMAISHTPDMEKLDVAAVQAMLDGLEGTGKPFIYTSGTLIYNDTYDTVVDENSPLNPLPFLQWKANQEQEVLVAAERNIRTIVIRPTLVYGRGGGLVQATIQRTKLSQSANYIDDGQTAWSTIDIDDLARLYECAFLRAQPGSLFNGTSKEMITTKELMTSIAKIAGIDKAESWSYEDAAKELGPAAWGASINQRISGLRAEQQLQWSPSANSLLKELEQGSYQNNKKP